MTNYKDHARSMLFVPGYQNKYFEKLSKLKADKIIIDLEDAVPNNIKDEARRSIREIYGSDKFKQDKERCYIRINKVGSSEFKKDIKLIEELRVNQIVVPKIISDGELEHISHIVKNEGGQTLKLYGLIETASGLINVDRIAAHSNCVGLIFGHEDYLESIRAQDTAESPNLLFARSKVVNSGRANRKVIIDSPYLKLSDTAGCREYAKKSRMTGFDGMLVLHPKQIEEANNGYLPTIEEIKESKRIIDIYKKGLEDGKTIQFVDNTFIAPPIIKSAMNKLNLAKYYKAL